MLKDQKKSKLPAIPLAPKALSTRADNLAKTLFQKLESYDESLVQPCSSKSSKKANSRSHTKHNSLNPSSQRVISGGAMKNRIQLTPIESLQFQESQQIRLTQQQINSIFEDQIFDNLRNEMKNIKQGKPTQRQLPEWPREPGPLDELQSKLKKLQQQFGQVIKQSNKIVVQTAEFLNDDIDSEPIVEQAEQQQQNY